MHLIPLYLFLFFALNIFLYLANISVHFRALRFILVYSRVIKVNLLLSSRQTYCLTLCFTVYSTLALLNPCSTQPLLYSTLALLNPCSTQPLLYSTLALLNPCSAQPPLSETSEEKLLFSAKSCIELNCSVLINSSKNYIYIGQENILKHFLSITH